MSPVLAPRSQKLEFEPSQLPRTVAFGQTPVCLIVLVNKLAFPVHRIREDFALIMRRRLSTGTFAPCHVIFKPGGEREGQIRAVAARADLDLQNHRGDRPMGDARCVPAVGACGLGAVGAACDGPARPRTAGLRRSCDFDYFCFGQLRPEADLGRAR